MKASCINAFTCTARLLASLESQRVHEDVLICMHNFRSNEDIQKVKESLYCAGIFTCVSFSTLFLIVT